MLSDSIEAGMAYCAARTIKYEQARVFPRGGGALGYEFRRQIVVIVFEPEGMHASLTIARFFFSLQPESLNMVSGQIPKSRLRQV
jgi:hypothetical protein